MTTTTNTQAVVQELQTILCEERVIHSPAELTEALRNTSGVHRSVLAVVEPISEQEIVHLVQWARRRKIPLYPSSRGCNWGYGTMNPVTTDSVVVHLHRMNKIVRIDTNAAVAWLQPGVSQRQLSEYLEKHHPNLMMNVTGGGPATSVMGNHLERGFGLTVIGEHSEGIMGMEVITGAAQKLRVGARNEEHLAPYKWGLGPNLIQAFVQSSFGICTLMGIRLVPRAKHVAVGLVFYEELEEAAQAFFQLNQLRQSGSLRGTLRLIHRDTTRLYEGMAATQEQQDEIPEWLLSYSLFGDRAAEIRVQQRTVRSVLPKGTKSQLLTEAKVSLLSKIPGWLRSRRFGAKLSLMHAVLQTMRGIPQTMQLKLAYTHSQNPFQISDPNPARDGCGLLWFPAVVPIEENDLMRFVALIRKSASEHQRNAYFNLVSYNGRFAICVFPIPFDPKSKEDTQRAQEWAAELTELARTQKYPVYRLGVDLMDAYARDLSSDEQEVYASLKASFDPDNILSPGRYSV